MEKCFMSADLLLPNKAEFEKWAVIACDQFTSDRAYWDRVENFVGTAPSTLRMVYPEIDLNNNPEFRISGIAETIDEYLQNGTFRELTNSFIYVERTLMDGTVRPGVVGVVDLEQYNYDPKAKPMIGATEQTILERVPPRIAIRRKAGMEFSHVILFCNDQDDQIMNPLTQSKDQLRKIYDFNLMENGGRIAAWQVTDDAALQLQESINQYAQYSEGTAFLVADGNHSLVTAKCWYEELKSKNPDVDFSNHPARYAMVELENILHPSIVFEAIHRVIFRTNPKKLLEDLQSISAEEGPVVRWISGEKQGILKLNVPSGDLPVAVFQDFLDKWLIENPGEIDYIHDVDALEGFAQEENAIGFVLPSFDKKELFAFGAAGNILPRKTFSLGHSREKRYYLEGRRIK